MNIYSIYRITNLLNGKVYIGFSKNPERRWVEHKRCSSISRTKISQAIAKYGVDSFSFEIIYQSKEKVDSEKSHTFTVMEDFFINEYNSIKKGYNLGPGGLGGDRISSHPNKEEYKKKLSNAMNSYNSKLTKEERSVKYGTFGKNNYFHEYNKTLTHKELQERVVKFEYTLTSPSGNVYTTKSLYEFCLENCLNRDILMKKMGKGKVPPTPKSHTHLASQERLNTVGWQVERKSIKY